MEDQNQETHSDKTGFISEHDQTHENTLLMNKDGVTNQAQEITSSCQEQKNPIPLLQRMDTLNYKIQILKKEHTALSKEVKCITAEPLPGTDVWAALRLLCTEHETLKKKYLEESLQQNRLHNEHETLKKKYLEESLQRRCLYNEVIELKGNIRVFCRCRPLNQDEISSGCTSVVDFDPSQETELQIVCSDSSRKQFKFDHVFGPQDNQEAVFAQTSPVVISVLDGFNVCIFAYGQTGTGKTFTMEGTPENRGVNYKTLEEVFRISRERSGTMKYELFVSMLEVYNEKIRDLLVENSNQPEKKLEIKQVAEGTQEVPGLVEAPVYNTDEVWELLKTGNRVRAVGSTNANELSSRSHCLLRVTVCGENLVNGQRTRSHLWLVDLAGSERVGKIEIEGERLKESQFINKSLSALGDVISALASKTSHIPYRNSKLTHLLQSSLGGDCKTLMFVQISPSSADLGETLCSLNFASRVRGIEHGPARKQADHSELFKYKQMSEKLRLDEKETKKLRDSLQSLQLRFSVREQHYRNLQEKNRDLENQLAEERKARLQQETRAATASTKSSASTLIPQGPRGQTEQKPPLGPSKLRAPLRRITNFLPLPSPVPPRKFGTVPRTARSGAPRTATSGVDKENIYGTTSTSNTKALMRPRRISIAVRPPAATLQVHHQPKRRVSIATIRPESHSSLMTPLNTSKLRFSNVGMMGRHFSGRSATTGDTTPVASRSKFLGSPQVQAGSWKPKHPTVVALQKRHFVWSPLKQRCLKNDRKSLLPSRFSDKF